jgi:hypothetical protein
MRNASSSESVTLPAVDCAAGVVWAGTADETKIIAAATTAARLTM